MKRMRKMAKVSLLSAAFTLSCTLTAFAASMVYDSGRIAYTHTVSSSHSCDFNWERTGSTAISNAGKDIADFTYSWNKGSLTSADSVTVEITKTYYSGNAVEASMNIVHTDGTTVSGSLPATSWGSKTLTGKLWKETASTKTTLTERLLGYTTICQNG